MGFSGWDIGPQSKEEGFQKGALFGSIGGPIGTGIGAGAGSIHGWLNSKYGNQGQKALSPEEQQRKMLMDFYTQTQGRGAPQAGPAAQSGYSDFRTNQSDLIGRLEALSKGQGPSLAAQQFQQATDRNMSSQQSMAQSGRGGPMAALNAANNMGQLGAQAAQGSAMARVQEQQMALNQLGLTLHGARGADESNNQFNANEQNQMSMGNLDAKLRAMGMNDSTRLQILQQLETQQGRLSAKPSFMEQLMAGGAGAMSLWASQKAQSNAAEAAKKAQAAEATNGMSSGMEQDYYSQARGPADF